MQTESRKISRIHYAAPAPRAYSALLAMHIAHVAVDREDSGRPGGAEFMARHARHHMERAARGAC